jgi:hypothetical protein
MERLVFGHHQVVASLDEHAAQFRERNLSSTILWHTGRMDEDQLFLRAAKPPPAGVDEHTYQMLDDLDCLKAQLAQLPRRREVWHAMALGIAIGAGVAVMLAEAVSRACS